MEYFHWLIRNTMDDAKRDALSKILSHLNASCGARALNVYRIYSIK